MDRDLSETYEQAMTAMQSPSLLGYVSLVENQLSLI
jgi:hypothetical protein